MKTQTHTAYNRYITKRKREDSLTRAIWAAILGVVAIIACIGFDGGAMDFAACSLWTVCAVIVGLFRMAQLHFSNR